MLAQIILRWIKFPLLLISRAFYKLLVLGNNNLRLLESQAYKLEVLEHPYTLRNNFLKSFKGRNTVIYSIYSIEESTIGDFTYIAQSSLINRTTIGKFCSIGPNFQCGWGIHPSNFISTHPMFYSTQLQNGTTLSDHDKFVETKPIVIGNDVFIGRNVIVLDGIKIGDGAIIGAGAVVSKDIPPYAIAVGNPIRVLRYRFDSATIEKLLSIQWWNWKGDDLKRVEIFAEDVANFVKEFAPVD